MNEMLANAIGGLNAVIAIILTVVGASLGLAIQGGMTGLLVGLLIGGGLAVLMCGLLALLISMRDELKLIRDQLKVSHANTSRN